MLRKSGGFDVSAEDRVTELFEGIEIEQADAVSLLAMKSFCENARFLPVKQRGEWLTTSTLAIQSAQAEFAKTEELKRREQAIAQCVSSAVASESKGPETIEFKGGVRVPGTGVRPQVKKATNVCVVVQPGWELVGTPVVERTACNEGRCEVDPLTTVANPDGSRNICARVRAWNENQTFGAGGWVEAKVSAKVSYTPGPDRVEEVRQACMQSDKLLAASVSDSPLDGAN